MHIHHFWYFFVIYIKVNQLFYRQDYVNEVMFNISLTNCKKLFSTIVKFSNYKMSQSDDISSYIQKKIENMALH